MTMLNLVSSTINNTSFYTTTIINNAVSPPLPTASTCHNHYCPPLSPPTTITNCPPSQWHGPTTTTTRWQCHVTSAERLNEHNTMLTAR
jgi:hypothetical protein